MDEQNFHRALEIDVLARTVWGEAGRQGNAVMTAIAHVVLNRVRAAAMFGQGWWGRTVIQVCQKPFQFRCWDASGPLHRKILSVDRSNRYFAAAERIAARVLARPDRRDPTKGATHYHRVGETPEWAARRRPTAVVNGFVFYQLLDL
jgi:N-acetylmuramoyl-L-alanine amidase